MRLDKFLKVSRLIKRRPVAKEIAEQGRIKINGSVAKASSSIMPGDELEIRFGQNIVTVKVNDVKDHVRKDEAAMLYDVLSEERINEES